MPVKAEEIHNEHRKIDKHTLVLYKCGGGGGGMRAYCIQVLMTPNEALGKQTKSKSLSIVNFLLCTSTHRTKQSIPLGEERCS